MSPSHRDPNATVTVTPVNPSPTPPIPAVLPPVDPSISELNTVLSLTSLNSVGGQPAQLSNLVQSNVVSNTNRSAQNAVANQQAHAQLALSVLGKSVTKVQNLGALESRSSVDVLTDNAIADEIAGLKAAMASFGGGGAGPGLPGRWAAFLRALRRFAREIAHIEAVNAHLSGTGTEADPYVITEGPLFVAAPITIGFPNLLPSQVNFHLDHQHVKVSG